jgi:hypothetical protein
MYNIHVPHSAGGSETKPSIASAPHIHTIKKNPNASMHPRMHIYIYTHENKRTHPPTKSLQACARLSPRACSPPSSPSTSPALSLASSPFRSAHPSLSLSGCWWFCGGRGGGQAHAYIHTQTQTPHLHTQGGDRLHVPPTHTTPPPKKNTHTHTPPL